MRVRRFHVAGWLPIFALLVGTAGNSQMILAAEEPNFSAADLEFFEKKVRPILVESCQKCHGEAQQKGGLRLDSRAAVLEGGESGPAVVPKSPEKSPFIEAILYDPSGYRMPPTGKLSEEKIAVLTEWVNRGVPWPKQASSAGKVPGEINIAERAGHWSFQPRGNPVPPQVKNGDWCRSPIDHFILQKLEQALLAPAPESERATWLRRVTFDLIGLPPSLEEVDDFLTDSTADAHARVVDRLLNSPHYGERWGRHWLDLVRYAESSGHEFDFEIPFAWPYRDYLVRAFNADVPYDVFVKEQLAGDLLPNPRRDPASKQMESVVGTAQFWFSQGKHSPVDIRADECELIDNQLDVIGKTFLGLTIACARCHDHKFDPIRAADYYALAGFLQSSRQQWADINPPELSARPLAEMQRLEAESVAKIVPEVAAKMRAKLAEFWQAPTQAEPPKWWSEWQSRMKANADHPFHPLMTVLNAKESPASGFLKQKEGLLKRWQQRHSDAQAPLKSGTVFADFSNGWPQGWTATGNAFTPEKLASGTIVWQSSAEWPIRGIVPRSRVQSGVRSSKLHGTLRSPTFKIESPYIDFHVARIGGDNNFHRANKHGQVNLIVDGFHFIQSPLWGQFSLNLKANELDGEPTLYRMDVRKAVGSYAYIEIEDQNDAELILERVLFTEGENRPALLNGRIVELLADPQITNRDEFIAASQRLLDSLISRWSESPANGKTAADPREFTNDDWELLNQVLKLVQQMGPSGVSPAIVEFAAKRSALEQSIPRPKFSIAMTDGTPENEHILIRGNHKKLGAEVPRRFLEVLAGTKPLAGTEQASGRLQLAESIVDGANPLTARVIVNRVWQHHFGRGIVTTSDDFGKMGQPPTHPELLDYLANQLVRNGWSLKALHRAMLLSSTYRMSSQVHDPAAEQADPNNRLWHRMPVQRLEGEVIRDSLLVLAGQFNAEMFGASVPTHLTPFMEGRGRPNQSGPLDGLGRRSIYLSVRRNFLNPMFLAFDFPTPFTTTGYRMVSNVPAQGLTMLNNPLVLEEARRWSTRAEAESDPAMRIRLLYRMAFARNPTEGEIAAGLDFLQSHREEFPNNALDRVWADYCHVLLNTKEFVFIE